MSLNRVYIAKRKRPSATIKKVKAKKSKNKSSALSAFAEQFSILKVGYFFLGLLLVSGIAYSAFWINANYQSSDDLMPLRVVEIEGDLIHVTREQIITQLLKSKSSEQPSSEIVLPENTASQELEIVGFFGSDLEVIEQGLEAIAWLQKAELRRVWPDKLHIKIKEQTAIAHWNNTALINEFGELFTPDSLEGLTKLPLLTGPDNELAHLLETFQNLQRRLESIDLQLVVLNLNKRYSWSLQLASGIELEVGREHLMERVERFITLYPLLERESKSPIAKVDLRYDTGLAVTRLESSELQASL